MNKINAYLGVSLMGLAAQAGNMYSPDPPSKKSLKGKLVDVRTEPKVRRNEKCPCGSGKKYKKCCANK
jgi:preprotein translocase subunit SecA